MANLDTRNKRASGLLRDRVYPNPDGSLANATDRAHVGRVYAFGADAPYEPPTDPALMLPLMFSRAPARTD